MKKTVAIILTVILTALTALPCFAAEKTPCTIGDLDKDGNISVSDARSVLRAAIKLDTLDEKDTALADFDKDGSVSVSDARSVLRVAIKLDERPTHGGEGNTDVKENEFKALSAKNYAMKGKMIEADGTETPLFLAKKGNNLYMSSSIDDLTVGMLVKDGKIYLLSEDRKYSLEFTSDIVNTFGMTDADLAQMTDASQFDMIYPDLETATEIKGDTCPICGQPEGTVIYVFSYEDGSRSEIYMNGNKLEKIESYTAKGAFESSTVFEFVTANVDDSYFALPSNILNRYKGLAGLALFMPHML